MCFYCTAADFDIAAAAVLAAADTCAAKVAAGTCTVAAACCGNLTAADFDIATAAAATAADTCAFIAACCGKRTCTCDGELTEGFGIFAVLLQACTVNYTFQSICRAVSKGDCYIACAVVGYHKRRTACI